MALPTFEDFLAGLDAACNAGQTVRIVIGAKGGKQNVCIAGDPDLTIPWLVEQGREALRRAAQGEALDPSDAAAATRELARAGE